MNTTTPRVFIAATKQNDGKTTASLGLLSALKKYYARIGFIKPVGQRFVTIEKLQIDEDSVLMDHVFGLNCPLPDMSPIAVGHDFTRKYIKSANNEVLIERLKKAIDRVAWEKEFVLCEGTGHAGVGSVFDLSNARVAKLIHAKVIIITQGGIGRPIDEIALSQALFEKEGVEILGVILNKVLPDKAEMIREFAEKGLNRRNLKLLGVIPHQPILSYPSMDSIREELKATVLNQTQQIHNLVKEVTVGAMTANNAMKHFGTGVLIITPGDREDIILAAAACRTHYLEENLSGIVLTGDILPSEKVLKIIRDLPYPVLMASEDSYRVASKVHDLTVKTRPDDTEKIELIRNLIAKHVNVEALVNIIKNDAASL